MALLTPINHHTAAVSQVVVVTMCFEAERKFSDLEVADTLHGLHFRFFFCSYCKDNYEAVKTFQFFILSGQVNLSACLFFLANQYCGIINVYTLETICTPVSCIIKLWK